MLRFYSESKGKTWKDLDRRMTYHLCFKSFNLAAVQTLEKNRREGIQTCEEAL